MNIQYKTFAPGQTLPSNIIFPQQSHGARIVETITGQEDLSDCDGIWTRNPKFLLGIKTADCAPICFWNNEQYGVLHAGWRGLVNGAVEQMLKIFSAESHSPWAGGVSLGRSSDEGPKVKEPLPQSLPLGGKLNELNIWVGPLYPQFEIQKDDCYDLIYKKFGDQFFTQEPSPSPSQREGGLHFAFKKCLQHLLPPQTVFDPRSTFKDQTLASWRRDKAFPNGQNVTVVGLSTFLQSCQE